jgi:D-aspartate ligase
MNTTRRKDSWGARSTARPPAVLCPLDDHMGLDIARSLSAKGISVFGIDADSGVPGKYSNALTFVHCPYSAEHREAEYIDFLVEFGQSLATEAVLYPLSDRHVLLFSQHRDRLAPYFRYVMPSHETMTELTTKNGLDSVCRRFSIPAPQTFFLSADTDIREIARKVTFPAVLKPTESTYWHAPEIAHLLRSGLFTGRAKVILCQDQEDLVHAFERVAAHDPRMIVQEVVPGEDSRLVYAAFYLDRSSTPLGYFSGRKQRVIPTGFGSASFVETFHDQELLNRVLEILSAVNYQGLGGLEFKQDPRDGQYKLIEFNTRFGMWDGLGVRCGVDLPYISYRDAIGLPVQSRFEFPDGMLWVDWQRDVRAFIEYRAKGELGLREWLRSFKGPKMLPIYSMRDPMPGVAFTLGLARKLASRTRNVLTGDTAGGAERP